MTTSPQKRKAANKIAAAVQPKLPAGLSQPALRALAAARLTNLDQLTKITERELLQLHGFGPKGVRIIQAALAEQGRALKE